MFTLFLFVLWLFNGEKKGRKIKEFIFFIFICFFFLLYSLFVPHNKEEAIWLDFFIELKPFIAFYCMYNYKFSLREKQKKWICNFCKVISVVFLIPVGIPFLFSENWLLHSARFCSMCEITGIVYLTFSKRRKKDFILATLMIALGICGTRSKFFGFLAIWTGMFLLGNKINWKHLLSVRNIILFLIIIGAGVYVAWGKIYFYFVVGTSSDMIYARPALYIGAFRILQKYPLFGTGLGSYANYASDVYLSPIYHEIKIDDISYEISNGLFLSDTFFPTLAQFGLVGIILFLIFWKKRIKEARRTMLLTRNNFPYKMTLMIVIFFLIESIADSTFTQNRGIFMMLILAMLTKDSLVQRKSVRAQLQ